MVNTNRRAQLPELHAVQDRSCVVELPFPRAGLCRQVQLDHDSALALLEELALTGKPTGPAELCCS